MRQRPKILLVLITVVCCLSLAIGQEKLRAKRARLPQFSPADNDVFFPDVFSRLVGERPDNPTAVTARPLAPVGGTSTTANEGGSGWSRIISSTTLEDEIKSIKLTVDKSVTTPSDFAGRGHEVVRREFAVLAMLFAIISEYDGDVRWKDTGPVAKQLFARAASNAKAGGNTNVYNEAKLRKQDLADLIQGSRLAATPAPDEGDWSEVVVRASLMQRLETASQERLTKWTSGNDAFSDNAESILHEAELTAAIADVLTREGMEDSDDEDYTGFADRMKQAAIEIAAAVKLDNQTQAREAAGDVSKACDACHESYR
jgi:cytochrome c556